MGSTNSFSGSSESSKWTSFLRKSKNARSDEWNSVDSASLPGSDPPTSGTTQEAACQPLDATVAPSTGTTNQYHGHLKRISEVSSISPEAEEKQEPFQQENERAKDLFRQPFPNEVVSRFTEGSQENINDSRSILSTTSCRSHRHRHRFISYKLKGEYQQPWKSHSRMNRTRINNYIVYGFVVLGCFLSVFICFKDVRQVKSHKYCLVLEDHFADIDSGVWSHEVQLDGFGTGSFDWTTTDSRNSFVSAEGLHIMPTLTKETTTIDNDMLYNGYTLNLTADGSCTSNAPSSCAIASNSTKGVMIPPVRSARLTTKGKKSIRYGRIEVVAELPKGDWLWPAIWMMPETSVYGIWPKSGEIDIMEARGNTPGYAAGGRDVFASTLHWGMDFQTDSFWRTTAGREVRRTDFSESFNTFGFEWSKDYIFTYLNSRLVQVLFTGFPQSSSLWQLGQFAGESVNQTLLSNPWANSTSPNNAPFDQNFYLILNVAVGGRNGWFPDDKEKKPWLNDGASAQWDFYRNADQWLPTWGEGNDRGMTVKSVKMWQQGQCT